MTIAWWVRGEPNSVYIYIYTSLLPEATSFSDGWEWWFPTISYYVKNGIIIQLIASQLIVTGWPLRFQVLSPSPRSIYPGLGRSRGGHRFAPSGDLETPHRHGQVVPGEVDAAGRKEGGGRVSVVVGLVAALFFFGRGGWWWFLLAVFLGWSN